MWTIWNSAWFVIYWLAYPFMWLRFHLWKNVRVRVLIMNEDSQILLVKNSFGRHRWTLPGGGIQKGETPEESASREVSEEVGLTIDAESMRVIIETKHGFEDNLGYKSIVLTAKSPPQFPVKLRRHEIMSAKWFNRGDLPKKHAEIVDKALENV